MCKFSKELVWLKPFIESVDHLISTDKIKSVKGFRVPFNKEQNVLGRTTKYLGKYTITLLTYQQRFDEHVPELIENILITLAHELAHLRHWDKHDADFANLFAEIFKCFAEELYWLKEMDIQKGHDTLWNK